MTDQISSEDRRHFLRFKAPITYRSAGLFSARKPLVDVGLGGIRVYSDDPLKIGKRLELELFLPDDTTVKCTAKVVWLHPLPEGSEAVYDAGLQFLAISKEDAERLEGLLTGRGEQLI